MRGINPLLSHSLITIAVIGLLGLIVWAGRHGRPRPGFGPHTLLFRYNALFRWFTYFAAFANPVGLTVGLYFHPPRGVERWYVLVLYLGTAALTLPLVWEASRFYVLITPDGLEGRSAWRGCRFFSWDDVQEVSYSTVNSWFVFRAADGDKIRVSGFVAGLKSLLGLVEMRVPASVLKNARNGYEKLGRPFPPLPDEPVLEARS